MKIHSDALAAIFETAHDLKEAGLITDAEMRRFHLLCLTNSPNEEPALPIEGMDTQTSQTFYPMCPWCGKRFDPPVDKVVPEFCTDTCKDESEENERELTEKRTVRGID